MQLTIQTSLLNVSDLDRSAQFYQEVFEFRLLSRIEGVVVLMISDMNRTQALALREVGGSALHSGGLSIGPRLLALEAGSCAELDLIEQRLVDLQALVGRRQTNAWRATVGIDPDRIKISVSSSLTGAPIQRNDWNHIDEMIYAIGE
jgi:catechol 2,3-dioxygenase-like lactoylglutathione lyase family enzyme